MYRKQIIIIAVLLLLLIIVNSANAQTKRELEREMEEGIENIEKIYLLGDIDSTMHLLEKFFDKHKITIRKLNREQQVELLRTYALSALIMDKLLLADSLIKEMRNLKPFYIFKYSDNALFRSYWYRYRPIPIFSAGIFVNTNTVKPKMIGSPNLVFTGETLTNTLQKRIYQTNITINAGALFSLHFTKRWALVVPISYQQYHFNYQTLYERHLIDEKTKDTINTYQLSTNADQKMNYLSIGAGFKYEANPIEFQKGKRKIYPYFQGGMGINRLINASKELAFETTLRGGEKFANQSTELGVKNNFYPSYTNVWGGLGVQYDVKKWSVQFSANYLYAWENITKNINAYPDLALSYYDATDNISFSNWQIGLGIQYQLNHKIYKK